MWQISHLAPKTEPRKAIIIVVVAGRGPGCRRNGYTNYKRTSSSGRGRQRKKQKRWQAEQQQQQHHRHQPKRKQQHQQQRVQQLPELLNTRLMSFGSSPDASREMKFLCLFIHASFFQPCFCSPLHLLHLLPKCFISASRCCFFFSLLHRATLQAGCCCCCSIVQSSFA